MPEAAERIPKAEGAADEGVDAYPELVTDGGAARSADLETLAWGRPIHIADENMNSCEILDGMKKLLTHLPHRSVTQNRLRMGCRMRQPLSEW